MGGFCAGAGGIFTESCFLLCRNEGEGNRGFAFGFGFGFGGFFGASVAEEWPRQG